MNGLSNLDETYVEYFLALTDMIWIDSGGQGSGSRQAVEMAHVDAAASESIF